MKSIVLEVCSHYIDSNLLIGDKITIKKKENAKQSYRVPFDDEIIALIDATVFGSCNNGLAFCNTGIYWHNDKTTSSNKTQLSWNEFLESEIGDYDNYSVQMGKGNLFNTSASMKKEVLIDLLKELQREVSEISGGDIESDLPPELPKLEKKEWYLGYNGKRLGPFTESEVKENILNDKYELEDLLAWKKGMKDWSKLIELELFSKLEELPPAL